MGFSFGPACVGRSFWSYFTGFTTDRQTDASDRLVTYCSVKPRILNKARFAIITYINRRELAPLLPVDYAVCCPVH